MNKKIIRIVFTANEANGALNWDEFEIDAINRIKRGNSCSIKVFIRHPKPMSELDYAVRRLCHRIESIGEHIINVSRENECVGNRIHSNLHLTNFGPEVTSETFSGFVSATYYIELR